MKDLSILPMLVPDGVHPGESLIAGLDDKPVPRVFLEADGNVYVEMTA